MNSNIRFRTAKDDFVNLQQSPDNDFSFDLDTQLNDMTEQSQIENDRTVQLPVYYNQNPILFDLEDMDA